MDDDSESLFGSPPPTPTRGRSPSPALALPSVSASIINLSSSSAQNVGTIALPGSHHVSELPVNPLALSLSYPPSQNGNAPRPPAHGFMTQVKPQNPAAALSVALPPRAKAKPAKKAKPKPKASAKASTARPTPPPIHLPDPSQSHPLPPNLLRNQPGLLGTAGVVAGVRPSHLPARSAPTQGTTSSNPILVDDEAPPPSRFKKPSCLNVDVASLPPPSNQDIVSTLLKQKDTVPLLENILKLIASEARPPAAQSSRGQSICSSDTGSRSQTPSDDSSSGTTKKRRKLRHVPAGAELWDVPFPFNEGEGPKAYRNEWEKDRGKTLITELVSLIKSAARKAAVANFMGKRKTPTDAELASIGKHYRIDTLFYGKNTSTAESEVLADTSNASRSSDVPSFDPSPPPSPPAASPSSSLSIPSDSASKSTSFDQLISSLLSVSSNDQLSFHSGSSPLDCLSDSPGPLDPDLFNSWMDIFQTFPAPAQGFNPEFKSEDYRGDLTLPDSLLSFDFPTTFPETPAANPDFLPATLNDFMLDPILQGLQSSSALPPTIDTSMSGSTSIFSDSGCPSLAASPIPSVSSYSFGPMTPTDGGWNGDAGIGVYSPGEDQAAAPVPGSSVQPSIADKGKGKKRDIRAMAEWTDAEKEALSFLEILSKSKLGGKGKGKAKAEEDGSQDLSSEDAGKEAQDDDFSKLRTVPILGHVMKADILNSAKERREHLARQIAKTRIALWETTIEGGVLAGLVQYYSKG
ncbi:hypothetical protein B0H11DRAFT_2003127 [Mycena galericulata]|nr:hypothetical protein B0H11DRAFT_2003127 [Mycena galericulata]